MSTFFTKSVIYYERKIWNTFLSTAVGYVNHLLKDLAMFNGVIYDPFLQPQFPQASLQSHFCVA